MHLGEPLYPVSGGRIFIRGAASVQPSGYGTPPRDYSGAKILIGIVEVPRSIEVERTHEARLNDRLWLNAHESRQPRTYMAPGDIAECDIPHLLTQMTYAAGFLPDSLELFVRETLIPHDNRGMRWVFVAGVTAQPLAALPADGLYEHVEGQGFRLVDTNTFNGDAMMGIIRTPQWGPSGNFGVSTSMEPKTFKTWLKAERSKAPRDARYAKFCELMAQRLPEQHVYDRQYHAERERVSGQVLREIMGMESAVVPTPAAARARARP